MDAEIEAVRDALFAQREEIRAYLVSQGVDVAAERPGDRVEADSDED